MVARIGLAVSLVVASSGVALGVWRTAALEDLEVHAVEQHTLREVATGGRARLGSAYLSEGTDAAFELCADDPMEPARWAGTARLQITLDGEVGIDTALDEALLERVRRDSESGCLVLGRGPVLSSGDYVMQAVFDELPTAIARIPIRARIVARRELGDFDLFVVVLIWLGSMLMVFFLAAREPAARSTRESTPEPDPLAAPRAGVALFGFIPASVRPGLAVVLGLAAMCSFFFGRFFPAGAAYSLAAGVTLALVEAGVALALVGGPWLAPRIRSLTLVRPEERWWLWFPGAVIAGVVLFILARLATSLVPSTSQSSISLFVSWPSGMLSFAALAVVAPLAEEIFFRGFIWAALLRYHRVAAFLGAWLLFVAFHASQTWGEWGALLAISVTGLGLTTIRAVSGSTLTAATAHLVYNGMLAVLAFG